ncbi:MAG: indole-3-glycerol phosphate synthase TrpC [Longimicrobiales bacterium]|nr:indole-3-glycerol phosphate synthase TrpC [Longimicrobiales bacterium]
MPETQGRPIGPGILDRIVRTKRVELEALRPRRRTLEEALDRARPPRGFRAALAEPGSVSVIAECKRRSPGAGPIRPDLDPAKLGRAYEDAGASAISVLTDETYFGGRLEDLEVVRDATSVPILRKDFTLHPLHLLEARGAGADAILLIVRILEDEALAALHGEARGLDMDVLVEVHDEEDLERALRIDADLVGINNRDLSTFTTDLGTTERLLASIPHDVVIVSESGIRTRDDVARLGRAGVDGILVGESLLEVDDPGRAAARLSGVASTIRGKG